MQRRFALGLVFRIGVIVRIVDPVVLEMHTRCSELGNTWMNYWGTL